MALDIDEVEISIDAGKLDAISEELRDSGELSLLFGVEIERRLLEADLGSQLDPMEGAASVELSFDCVSKDCGVVRWGDVWRAVCVDFDRASLEPKGQHQGPRGFILAEETIERLGGGRGSSL